jgi:hypothetical protein
MERELNGVRLEREERERGDRNGLEGNDNSYCRFERRSEILSNSVPAAPRS